MVNDQDASHGIHTESQSNAPFCALVITGFCGTKSAKLCLIDFLYKALYPAPPRPLR